MINFPRIFINKGKKYLIQRFIINKVYKETSHKKYNI